MVETRLRGQEASIRIARGNVVEDTVTAIKNFTAQLELAILEEGYLGETTVRKDDIFNGISGSFDVDYESQDVLVLIDAIKQRAQRRPAVPVQSTTINATVRFTFPNGDTPRILVKDMKFGALPINIGARDSYIGSSLSYGCEDIKFITT